MLVEQFCLALHQGLAGRDEDVRLAQIAVPLRNLVFEDGVIAKRVPRQHRHLAMILMRIVARVAEDHVGRYASFQRLEPCFDVGSLVGEESVLELRQLDDRPRSICKVSFGGCTRLVGTPTTSAQHGPVNVQTHAAPDPAEDRCAGADFNVVRMSANAKNGQALARTCKFNELHPIFLSASAGVARAAGLTSQGIVPFSTRSSSICLSFNVSIGRQKPSCRKAMSWSASIKRLKGVSTSSSPSRMY